MPLCRGTQTRLLYGHVLIISLPTTVAFLLGSKIASLWEQILSSAQGTMTVPGFWVVSAANTLEGQRNAISQQGRYNSAH